MKISLYTAMRDCIQQDYPFLEMLRHHLPLADEIVVNEGYSTDGTYEAICGLDPKVKVFRTHWQHPHGESWWIHFKNEARLRCTGDWCVHLDCDEFIPEWEFEELRHHLTNTVDSLVGVRFTNFYGNYRVFHPRPADVKWITHKIIIHRNLPDIQFWGDGANVRLGERALSWNETRKSFNVHHFGCVRSAAKLRQAWWSAGRFRRGKSIRLQPPALLFKLFPHCWTDPQFFPGLEVYNGPLIAAVVDNPGRFVRDDHAHLPTIAPTQECRHLVPKLRHRSIS